MLVAHIVDGVLMSVGALPTRARRMDTGQMLFGAQILDRLEACDLYELAVVDPATLTTDPDKLATLKAEIAAARSRALHRDQFETAVDNRTDLARGTLWDWIDDYCSANVAAFPFVRDQSPNAGQNWPALAANQALALREGVSKLAVVAIQLATAVRMLKDVVLPLLEAADIDPPADR